MKNFNGYSIKLMQDGDKEWRAFLVKLPQVVTYGDNPEDALSELRVAWEGYVARCQARGEAVPYNDEEE